MRSYLTGKWNISASCLLVGFLIAYAFISLVYLHSDETCMQKSHKFSMLMWNRKGKRKLLICVHATQGPMYLSASRKQTPTTS